MAKEKKQPTPETPNNVVTIERCCTEGCKSRASRAGFCNEHFLWFKEGLVTREGKKVKDFDQKHQQLLLRKTA